MSTSTPSRPSEPRVSIQVPIFRNSGFLPGCLEGIRAQTFQDYEVILIVDSHVQEDVAAAHREASGDARIRVVFQKGEGLGDARNAGIEAGGGEVVWFLDVDDRPMPTFLEDLLKIMDDRRSDVVFCNHMQIRKGKGEVSISDGPFSVKEYSRVEAVSSFTDLPVYSWSRIQKRSVLVSGSDYFGDAPSMEDLEQTVRLLLCSDCVCYYGKPLYVYCKARESATSRNRSNDAEAVNQIGRRLLQAVKEGCPDAYPAFCRLMAERIMRQMAFSPYKEYKKYFADSAAHIAIKDSENVTKEMLVFKKSKLLYYLVLFPFTHWRWDRKVGVWGPLRFERRVEDVGPLGILQMSRNVSDVEEEELAHTENTDHFIIVIALLHSFGKVWGL